jgi:hypothetical protein
MLVLAYPRSLVDKLATANNAAEKLIMPSHPDCKPSPCAGPKFDAVQCKQISAQNKASRRHGNGAGRLVSRRPLLEPQKLLRRQKFASPRAHIWTSKFCRAMGLSCRRRRFD